MSDLVEINAETGEVIERDFTKAEAAQRATDQADAAAAAAAKAEQDALAAQARQKIAESSGLTADEMAALGF